MTETETTATGSKSGGNVRQLPTEALYPNDYNPNRMTDEEYAELLEEVRYLGRLPKPVVVRNGYAGEAIGAYLIVDGEHGWRAAKEVGLAEVTCEVIEADDFEAMRQTYKRNQHGTHDRAALGEMFKRMREERDISNRELAKEINVSEGTIRNALIFAEAAESRRRWAPDKGATADDYHFSKMTTDQARHYVTLPEGLRNLWLNGGAKPIYAGETWGTPEEGYIEDLEYYLEALAASGIVEVFKSGGRWDEKAKLSYELMMWRSKHRCVFGDDIDAYIKPVIDKRPAHPTHTQILDSIPMHNKKPILSPEEWTEALRVAWDKSERVYEVLSRFADFGKLKAAEMGVPEDDLEDPKVALMKLEVEKHAPAFIREADLPLHDKHFLTTKADRYVDFRAGVDASSLSDKERFKCKQVAVKLLLGKHGEYREQTKAYEDYMASIDGLPPDQWIKAAMSGAMGGTGPKRPTWPPPAEKVWVACIQGHYAEQEQAEKLAQQAELMKTFEDPERVVEAIVERFNTAAPKVFGQEVGGKVASEVLRERLKSMPEPELLLLEAVMLKARVTVWLEAVRAEE
jgi:ParB/RepB/Spo0J family partition protein